MNRENIQLAQIKKAVRKENPGVLPKKLKRKMNRLKKEFRRSSFKDVFRPLTGAIFSQISKDGRFSNTNLNEEVKIHGEKSIEVMLIELSQLDNMSVFTPLMINELSKKEKKIAPNLLVIIREKRSGKIKSRVVADGSKQRNTMLREDIASPKI